MQTDIFLSELNNTLNNTYLIKGFVKDNFFILQNLVSLIDLKRKWRFVFSYLIVYENFQLNIGCFNIVFYVIVN